MEALVGRERELARLEEVLDRGSALMLRGSRGSGVSALVDATVARAREHGMGVLRATGVQWESGFPYAGLHQLLRRLRGPIAQLPGVAGEALRGLGESTPAPAEVARALVALADTAAADRPLLLAVDEWQWIDAETREAIAAFARSDAPVALLLGGHVGGPSGVEELLVGPLDADASEALLAAPLPLLVRERILREAAGNPLALSELPEAYAGAGDGVLLGSWAPLTWGLSEAFGAGLERLDAIAGLAVLVAALDDGGDVGAILATVSDLADGPVTREALKPAVALGLIELDGDRLTFAHPLTRAAVRHRADPAARRAGHEAFAAVVAESDPSRAIWHRVVAAPGLDPELAGELEAIAARGDFERAAAAMRRAANLTPPGPERSRRLTIAAQFAHEIGGVELADRLLEQAGELDTLGRARAASLRPGRTAAFLTHARVAADAGEHELALRLCWLAATTERGGSGAATIVPDPDAPERLFDARGHEPEVLARIAARAAAPDERAARPAAAPEGPARLAAPGELSRHDLAERAAVAPDELALLGFAAFVIGDPRLASELAGRAETSLRAQRRRTPLGPVLVLSAWSWLALSGFERAHADAAEAVWLNERTRQPVWGAAAHAALAALAALRGGEAERHAAEAERVALPARVGPVLALVQQARGALALADGRPAEAFAHLRRPFDPTDPSFDRPWAVNLVGDLAEAATTAPQRDFVTTLLAETPPTPAATIAAAHARLALVTTLLADTPLAPAPTAAGRLALGEPAEFDDRWAFTHARMLLLRGMQLRRARRMADSRAPLRAAETAFATLGATPWAERAARELAATVETTQRGEDRLTPQELEIARMAARGMTNPAIAADLALSPRTVSHHLARIFPKLDVSSRAGLAKALERFGY